MSGWKRHFRAASAATEPRPGAVERLQARATWPGQVLRQATIEPRAGAVERLRAGRPRRSPGRRRLAVASAVVLAAAGLLLALWRPATPLSAPLVASTESVQELTPDVRLAYEGAGAVAGTDRAPAIRWEAGTIAVEVTPGEGVDLSVQTDEAVVRVVGTAFRVTRDALGTTVTVDRGRVRVTCAAALPHDLQAGDHAECTPVRAAGWIGRTQALARAGRPTDELLVALDHGLALATPGDPAAGELEALRIRVLMDAARYDEALQVAERYLVSGAAPRRDEVAALAAALRERP